MTTELTDVPGIGPRVKRALERLGIETVAALAEADTALVARAPGLAEVRATGLIAAAAALLHAPSAHRSPGTELPTVGASKPVISMGDDRPAAKGTKDKKKKKKDNKKSKRKDKEKTKKKTKRKTKRKR